MKKYAKSAPKDDEVRLGTTLWELGEGANALTVNGSEEILIVEDDDNKLFLRQNGKDTSIVGMVLAMYCPQCTRVSAHRMEFDPECGHEVFSPTGDVCGCDMANQIIIAVGPRNDDMEYENWQKEGREDEMTAAERRSEAARKAWATRRKNEAERAGKRHKAAKKAWRTMKACESKMTDAERKALHRKRSRAAKKAWKTIRAKAA